MIADIRVVSTKTRYGNYEPGWINELKNKFGERFVEGPQPNGFIIPAYETRIGILNDVTLEDIVTMQNDIFEYQLDIDNSDNGIIVLVVHNDYRE